MSSFISKSKKAFRPKAPQVRRGVALSSTTPSVRGSQEPQKPTPQTGILDPPPRGVGQTTHVDTHDQGQPSTNPVISRPVIEAQTVDHAIGSRPILTSRTAQESTPQPGASSAQGIDAGAKRGSERTDTARREAVPTTPVTGIGVTRALPTPDSTQILPAQPAVTNTVRDNTREQGASALLQLSQSTHASDGPAHSRPRLQSGSEELQSSRENETRPRRSTRRADSTQEQTSELGIDAADSTPIPKQRKRKTGNDSNGLSTTTQGEGKGDSGRPAKRRRKSTANTSNTTTKITRSSLRKPPTAEEQADAVIAVALGEPAKNGKSRRRRTTGGSGRRSQLANDADAIASENGDGDEDYSDDEDDSAGAEGAEEAAEGDASGNDISRTKSRRPRKREKTPPDAGEQRINTETQKLGDLPDLRIGRLGPRELKLRERDEQEAKEAREERQAAAREELKLFMHLEGEQREQAMEAKAERDARDKEAAREKEERERAWRIEDEGEWSFKPRGRWGQEKRGDDEGDSADRDSNHDNQGAGGDGREESPENVFHSSSAGFRIVDGMIVANPGARTLDAAPVASIMETRIETDIDRRVTGASYAHREARGRWDADRLDAFYEGLRRWGTDFGMVATWVPGMSRNQVKRKYTLEEKANPELITDALRLENRISTSLEEIEEKRGRALRDPKDWQADVERRENEMRERAAIDKKRAEEVLRNRGNPNIQAQAQLQSELSSAVANASTDAGMGDDEDHADHTGDEAPVQSIENSMIDEAIEPVDADPGRNSQANRPAGASRRGRRDAAAGKQQYGKHGRSAANLVGLNMGIT